MKKTFLTLTLAAASALASLAQVPTGEAAEAFAKYNRGVGPVMEASVETAQLPEKSQAFLAKYFPGVTVTGARNDFSDRRYEVRLSDGAEVEFDYDGNWVEIEAPDGAKLPSSTLSALMPESVVTETLRGNGVIDGGVYEFIDEVASFPDYYLVDVKTPQGMKTRLAVSRTDGSMTNFRTEKGKCERIGTGALLRLNPPPSLAHARTRPAITKHARAISSTEIMPARCAST